MLFNSLHFAIFFVLVVTIYYALPHRWRWLLLLASSYYFYMCWSVRYGLIIAATTLIDYTAARWIDSTASPGRKRLILTISLSTNLGVLFTFKYFNFAVKTADDLLRALGVTADLGTLSLALPIGISFYTFQSIAYVIDVYRGKLPAERSLGYFATFVIFFPQLVAGPISRATQLLPQFHQSKPLLFTNVRYGLERILWGLFKKMVVADTLAAIVNEVFKEPARFSGPVALFATVLFAIQVYCDFSGYSDIALGSARVMGFDLIENFRRPFFATSMTDLWCRWHISLTNWFRDYVYFPLGGNRTSRIRAWINIIATFSLSGLWHGPAWTYVLWGASNGVLLVVGKETSALRERFAEWIGLTRFPALRIGWQRFAVFSLFILTLVFFRSPTLSDAFYILGHGLNFSELRIVDLTGRILPKFEMVYMFTAVSILFIVDYLIENPFGAAIWRRRIVRWPVYLAAAYSIVLFGVFEHIEFVYFQF